MIFDFKTSRLRNSASPRGLRLAAQSSILLVNTRFALDRLAVDWMPAPEDAAATCKTLGVAARLSPLILRVNTPLSWISTACSGPEGPAASQKAENKGIDVFSTERRDTGG